MTNQQTSPSYTATVQTPAGPFTVVSTHDDQGAPVVLASGWTDSARDLLPLVAAPIRPTDPRHVAVSDPAVRHITGAVIRYHDGDVSVIDTVTVAQSSGPFLQRAWQELRAVPAGSSVTYTELAQRAGRPAASRAAGSACSRNAAALFVPCHRVLPAAGGVGSFRWGPSVKRWLLDHEAA